LSTQNNRKYHQYVIIVLLLGNLIFSMFLASQFYSSPNNAAVINQMQSQIDSQSSQISILLNQINDLQDQLYRAKIPEIVRHNIGTPDLLVNALAHQWAADVKIQYKINPLLYPLIDGAAGIVANLSKARIPYGTISLVNATKLSTGIYNATIALTIPISISEIPVLSALQDYLGDITIYVKILFTARVDAINEGVSSIRVMGITT
jgi:hypothetical protein